MISNIQSTASTGNIRMLFGKIEICFGSLCCDIYSSYEGSMVVANFGMYWLPLKNHQFTNKGKYINLYGKLYGFFPLLSIIYSLTILILKF